MKKRTTKKKKAMPNKMAYEGKVKVTLYHGSTAYKTIEKKNEGAMPLFRFFANCLCGNMFANDRPYFIRLYSVNPDNVDDPSSWTEITSTAIPLRTTPTVKNGVGNDTVVVTEEFLIPAATMSEDAANLVVLFSQTNKNARANWSARVLLGAGSEIQKDSGTTNILVEWSLIIGNK